MSNSKEGSLLVSIIIPVYNVEEYLECCLDSVIRQTYTNIEIILVDDGSTDGSSGICDDYAQKDGRIVVIHKANGGLSDARNKGLEIATGQYVTFIDSDDCVNLSYVERLISIIEKNDADISICWRKNVDDSFNAYNCSEKENEAIVLDNRLCVKESYFSKYKGINATAWSKMYKTSLFHDNNITYPVGELHEDVFTTYKLLFYAIKVVYIDDTLYYYRQRSGSIMSEQNHNFNVRNMRVSNATEEAIIFYLEKEEIELATLAINYHIRLLFGLNYRLSFNKELSDSEKKRYLQEMKKSVIKYLDYGLLGWKKQLVYMLVATFPTRFLLKKIGV